MHILKYTDYKKDGIFGTFQFSGDETPFCKTLSHAYPVGGTYQPIVSQGRTCTCQRGEHKLHNGIIFETFEILGIEGHKGLLFHPLNFNIDSEGCTGLGKKIIHYDSNHDGKITADDDSMITDSKATFSEWMHRLDGVNSFTLLVQ